MKRREAVRRDVAESNLTQRVSAALREDIVTWKLRPGEALSEAGLASQLDVSRTPVREALRTLQHEGLVKVVPGRGVFVADIGLRDVVEIFQMREALEVYAARLSAQNDSARADFAALRTEFEQADQMIGRGRVEQYYALSARLDQQVVHACGNRRIEKSLRTLWDQARRLRRAATLSERRLRETVDEHEAILEAIVGRDVEGAELAVRRHSENSLQNLMSELWRSSEPLAAASGTSFGHL